MQLSSIQCYTQNETTPPPQKWNIFIWILALSHEGCDADHLMGTELSDRLFGQNKTFFFFLYICVFVFCGECGCICMTSICVADNQLWLLWLNDSYHYECWSSLWTIWPISIWLSSLLPHTSVCDYWLSTISVNVWQYQCMSVNQSMYVSMYYIQSFFLIYFYYSNYSYCMNFCQNLAILVVNKSHIWCLIFCLYQLYNWKTYSGMSNN